MNTHAQVAEVQEDRFSAKPSENDTIRLVGDYGGSGEEKHENGALSRKAIGECPAVIYLDPRTLTRECVGRYLQANLNDLQVCLHAKLDTIVGKADLPEVSAVIVNTGPEPMTSPATTTLLAEIGETLAGRPIVVVSDHDDPGSVFDAFELGARGYIPTSLATVVAVEAVRLVCAGGTFAPTAAFLPPPRQRGRARSHPSPAIGEPMGRRFTPRQTQVLERLQRGLTNKVIAYELDMCESTVKVHVRNIMKKLKATNRTQVVCLTRGMVQLRSMPAD